MIEVFMNIDGGILIWIQEHLRTLFLTPFFVFITTLGDKGLIWILLSLGLLLSKKTRKIGIISLLALICSLLLNNLFLKNLVGRERPFNSLEAILPLIGKPTDLSFPSGHTASSFASAWVFLRHLPKKYGIPAIILASLIAFSRLYLGVHYPSDVLVGIISGIFVSFIAEFIWERSKGYLGKNFRILL